MPAMSTRPPRRAALPLLPALLGVLAGAAPAAAQVRHTAADAEFMRGMIAHHAQALVMARLAPERTSTRPLLMLAERIDVSQEDEIALMRLWLERRGEALPPAGTAHGQHEGHLMPGMLTAGEIDRLAAERGTGFDRLFLEFMIRHHQGALTMVADLFGTPGAGQETEIFRFASDVEADQRAEIRRMQQLLQTLPGT
jgi:uncharacterized protein (DUF305 family)